MHWTSWFGHAQFYQIALLYMLSRLYINVSQVYFPFYITLTQGFDKVLTWTDHFLINIHSEICGYFADGFLHFFIFCVHAEQRSDGKQVIKKGLLYVFFSRESKTFFPILYTFGLIAGLVSCAVMLLELPGWRMYGLAVGIGIAQAILLITSLSITADLINKNTVSYPLTIFVFFYLTLKYRWYRKVERLSTEQWAFSTNCQTELLISWSNYGIRPASE